MLPTLSRKSAYLALSCLPVFAPVYTLAVDFRRMTQEISGREWSAFGLYAEKAVDQVAHALEQSRSLQDPCRTDPKNVKELETLLKRFLCKASKLKTRSLIYRVVFGNDEYLIEHMRQELDDALQLIQFTRTSVMMDYVSETLSAVQEIRSTLSHSTTATLYRPDKDSTSQPAGCSSSSATKETIDTMGGDATADPSPNFTFPILSKPTPALESIASHALSYFQGVDERSKLCGPGNSDSKQGDPECDICSAAQDVEYHRLLTRKNPGHITQLASALQHLSGLLRNAGRLDEAFFVGDEATEIYKSLVEQHPARGITSQQASGPSASCSIPKCSGIVIDKGRRP